MANNLPTGSEAITDPTNSAYQMKVNADGSINVDADITASIDPAANQRVNAQSGDFVAGSVADLTTLLALAGTSGDANTINSFMGRFTKIRDLLNGFGLDNTNEQKVSLYGKGSGAAGDTALLLDSAGRLNVNQNIAGSVLSATNAEPNISNLQQLLLNGQAFTASTGVITPGANAAAQLYVPNTGAKNILIYSLQLMYTNAANPHQVQLITATDANITTGTGHTAPTPQNNALAATAATAVFTYCTAIANAGVATGNPIAGPNVALNATVETFTNGRWQLIPPATAGGIGIYMKTTAAGSFSITISWVEF